jgi:hypothetical protein
MMKRLFAALACGSLAAIFSGPKAMADELAAQFDQPAFVQYLYDGQVSEAARLAAASVELDSDDGLARFSLGLAQFLQAVEELGHGFYNFGMQPAYNDEDYAGLADLPFLRLPLPVNPEPQDVTYEDLRGVLSGFVASLAVAEQTLSIVPDTPLDLPIDLGRVRLDFNRNGAPDPEEHLIASFLAVSGPTTIEGRFAVDLDASDAPWLQGYCNLLMAMTEIILAYDWEYSFDQSFHAVFPATEFPNSEMTARTDAMAELLDTYRDEWGLLPRYPSEFYSRMHDPDAQAAMQRYTEANSLETRLWAGAVADIVAFLHGMSWQVADPESLQSARLHLLAMIATSRENWRRIMAETDNQREWVPSPSQTGIFRNMRTGGGQVEAWAEFLNTLEAILEGERLIAHWRFSDLGINLRRMIEDPGPLDPVMIAAGPAVLPYLEEGETLTGAAALDLIAVFGRGFIAYFIWFN